MGRIAPMDAIQCAHPEASMWESSEYYQRVPKLYNKIDGEPSSHPSDAFIPQGPAWMMERRPPPP